MEKTIGLAAALGSAAAWALGSILFKRLGEKISSVSLTFAKGLLSVFLLGLVLPLTGFVWLDTQAILLLVFSGLLGIALGDVLFFEALQDLGPHALIVLATVGQVITAVLAVAILGDRPSVMAWIGILLVVSGVVVVLYARLKSESGKSNWRGIVLGLGAVLSMSVSIIILKQGLDSVSTIQATFIRMVAGTVGLFVLGAMTNRLGDWTTAFRQPRLFGSFLVAVCVVTFGGFWLSLVGVKYLDVSVANTLGSTEPLFVLPMAVVLLKERIPYTAIAGTSIAVLGIGLMCAG